MASDSGSQEPQASPHTQWITAETRRITLAEVRTAMEAVMARDASPAVPVTTEELDRIADGEPYCFRCGKPASSFSAYRDMIHDAFPEVTAADYVRDEEGTYNPETNRFACDACYIAIGTPSAPNGWRAP